MKEIHDKSDFQCYIFVPFYASDKSSFHYFFLLTILHMKDYLEVNLNKPMSIDREINALFSYMSQRKTSIAV
jgi:hypothetical protein